MEQKQPDYKALEKHLADGLEKAKESLAKSEAMLKKVEHVRERLQSADGKLDTLLPEESHTHEERIQLLALLKELLEKGELAQLSTPEKTGPSSPHLVGAHEEGSQHVIYQ